MIIRHKKTTLMSRCSRVNISTITYYCNDIMLQNYDLSYVFNYLYTSPQACSFNFYRV